MSEYNYIRIVDEEYYRLKELYFECFNHNESIDSIKIKYNTSCFGGKNIGFLALSNQMETAGYYGVFPMLAEQSGSTLIIAQSGDTMTSPKHQKKGLFITLAKMTYDLAAVEGIKLIFGFPNENSYPGFVNKLQWKFTGNMKRITILGSKFPLCEASAKFKWARPFYKLVIARKIKRLQAPSPTIFQVEQNDHNIRITRNIDFLNHKLSKPGNYFLIKNEFKFLVKIDAHLVIGDVEKFDLQRSNDFFATVISLGKQFFCNKIIFTLSENHWLFPILSMKFGCVDSLPIGFYTIDEEINIHDFVFIHADYDTF